MNSLAEISTEDFQNAVTPEVLRVTRIIFLALAGGVIFFGGIVGLLYTTGGPHRGAENMVDSLTIYSAVTVVFLVVAALLGKFTSSQQFSPSRLKQVFGPGTSGENALIRNLTPADRCIMLIRLAWLLQLATLEGAAFLGLCFSLVAVTSGVAYIEPVYMANMLAALPILLYVAIYFPTVDRFTEVFKTKIQNQVIVP